MQKNQLVYAMICPCTVFKKMHSIKVYFLLLSLFMKHVCSSFHETQRVDSKVQKKIDDFVENVFLPFSGVSGLGLAVVQNDGELLYTTGYGFADHEEGIRNGNDTQFLLGSVTKTFTALVVVKALHEAFPEMGEDVLDTPIRKLLPHSNFTLIDRFRTEHATFRDLLSHKLCIPRDDFQLMTEPFETTSEILYRQSFAEESCGFRTSFVYNNHMVLYASELIRHLDNQTFEQVASKLLLEIGMLGSSFVKKTDFSRIPARAKPYYIMDSRSYTMNPELMTRLANIKAIGGLYVTPNDMAQFLRFQLNMGRVDGKVMIPEEVMSWLTKPSSLYPKFNFKVKPEEIMESPLAYGLGLMIGSYDGWQRISHNGYFTPYRTEISWYPAPKIGIFSSTHEAPTNVKQQVLHTFIFETLLGNEYAYQNALKSLMKLKSKFENEENSKENVLEMFMGQCKNKTVKTNVIGKYGNRVSGEVEILPKYKPESDQVELYIKYGKWARGWLERVGGCGDEESFKIDWDTALVQDYLAAGDKEGSGFLTIKNDGSLNFVRPTPYGMITYAQFKREVT